jgi:hypothetical protein
MDRETLERVWRAEERTRGRSAIDFPFLVDAAAERGPLGWRDAAELALRERTGNAARPMQLLEFVTELAHELGPNSVLDPWVEAPTVLAAAHEASGSIRSCGFVPDERLWRAAHRIASLDWRLGDPLVLLGDLSHERFDLVIAKPPFGMHANVAQEPDDPRGRVDIADLILWRVAPMVADHGAVLFHTSDDFFWAKPRRRLWPQFAERGLHPRAVISVDPALSPVPSISASLVLFTREGRDQLFVGRLERSTSVPALVRNLIAGQTDDDPQLGVLTSADSFRGWRPLMLEQELARMFGSSELRALTDVGRIRAVNLRPHVPYDPPGNCIFVPTLGFGNVLTVPPDLEGRRGYRLLEIQLDPTVALAEYVAGLLSSPQGKRLREGVSSGSGVPHLTVTGAEVLRLPVPAISAQVETVRGAAQLASMETTITRLRDELWRRPQDASQVLSELEVSATVDPARRWLDTLPYPLASVLQRYTALRGPTERLEALLHFYEATGQFCCAVLLSILRADSDLLESARSAIAGAAGVDRDLLDRADFGMWINLGRTLAKAIRRVKDTPGLQEHLGEAAGPATELMERLAGKRIWEVLDQARRIRNRRAHSGLISPDEAEGWIGSLEVLLSGAERALGTGLDDIDLAIADQGRFSSGLHVYPRAQRLRGPSTVFEEFELRTRAPLESGHLVLVSRDVAISSVLMLVPLVRVGGATRAQRNACYFFSSRLDDGRFAYVSYHFEDEPQLEVEEPELRQLELELSAPST